MKLFTDEGNPFTLKVLLASNVAKADVEIKVVDKKTFKKPAAVRQFQLPILELNDGQYLVSPNAMCSYIMGCCVDAEADQWIEWDAVSLQPATLPFLIGQASGGKEAKISGSLSDAMKTLNGNIGQKKYLLGDTLSVADIVVWGSLFGVLHGNRDAVSNYSSLESWFQRLSTEETFVKAVSDVTKGKGNLSFRDSLQGYVLPPICAKSTGVKGGERQTVAAADTPGEEDAEGLTQVEIDAAKASWLSGRKGIHKPRTYDAPVLPRDGEKNLLVTSALPYVNNVPHLGNIIGCVLSGDVYSRFCRLRNYNIIYICGTDEYGTATETKAIEEGLTPQQICDKYHKIHADIYKWFNIEFDCFGRTTTEEQTKIAQDIFWKIEKNKFLLEDTLEQLQCIKCSRFLADRFVEGTCPFCSYEDARGDQCDACGKLINAIELKSPRCKMCGTTPKVRTSKHIFLDLPKIEPQLRQWSDESMEKGNWTANSKNITKGWLHEGLKPRCITRDLKWGTAVPMEGFKDKVFYVWFDAPIGYLSITANYTEHWEKWWKNPEQVRLIQFMAKDNVPFHTVVFPCSLLGADDNYTLLNDISATEYLNYEDDKFSKSRGVGVFGDNAEETGIPADIFRFYLLLLRPENQDSAFSWADFVTRNNSELLNNLGNFINRALVFLKNYFDSTIQPINLNAEDEAFLASVNRDLKNYVDCLEKIKLRDGLRHILSISKTGNQYMQAAKPWVLVKGNEQEKARAATVISLACNLGALLGVLLKPYMPMTSDEICSQTQLPKEHVIMVESFVPMLEAGHKIGIPSPLFQKIDVSFGEMMKAKFAGKGKPTTAQKKANENKEKLKAAASAPGEDKENIQKLEEEVAKQGAIVRKVKQEQEEKDLIAKEIEKLLDLKKRLALAQGVDPNESAKGGKSKKKTKKK
eukprot:gene14790-5897_t